jgi:hypothetical protein
MGIKSGLAQGSWLTAARVRAYLILLAIGNLIGLAGAVLRAHGWWLPHEPHFAIEFLSFYAAGKLALGGHAAAVYAPGMAASAFIASPHMPPAHMAMEAAVQSDSVYFAYFYPPIFLSVCAVLAALPFYPAFFAWVGLTGALAAGGARYLSGDWRFWLPAAAYLPVIENAGVGETAFAATGIFAWSWSIIDRRPALAGALLACLSIKPQFLLPVCLLLLFTRRLVALIVLLAGVLVLIALSAGAFGLPAWDLYATITVPHAAWVFANKGVSYALQVTPASAVLLLGGPHAAALAVQAAFSLFAAYALLRARRAGTPVQGAMLAASFPLLLTTMLTYDALICGLAVLILVREARRTGFLPYEKSVAALMFAAPLVTFVLRPVHLPVDPLIPALFLASTLRRCATAPDTAAAASPAGRSRHTPPDPAPAR